MAGFVPANCGMAQPIRRQREGWLSLMWAGLRKTSGKGRRDLPVRLELTQIPCSLHHGRKKTGRVTSRGVLCAEKDFVKVRVTKYLVSYGNSYCTDPCSLPAQLLHDQGKDCKFTCTEYARPLLIVCHSMGPRIARSVSCRNRRPHNPSSGSLGWDQAHTLPFTTNGSIQGNPIGETKKRNTSGTLFLPCSRTLACPPPNPVTPPNHCVCSLLSLSLSPFS